MGVMLQLARARPKVRAGQDQGNKQAYKISLSIGLYSHTSVSSALCAEFFYVCNIQPTNATAHTTAASLVKNSGMQNQGQEMQQKV